MSTHYHLPNGKEREVTGNIFYKHGMPNGIFSRYGTESPPDFKSGGDSLVLFYLIHNDI